MTQLELLTVTQRANSVRQQSISGLVNLGLNLDRVDLSLDDSIDFRVKFSPEPKAGPSRVCPLRSLTLFRVDLALLNRQYSAIPHSQSRAIRWRRLGSARICWQRGFPQPLGCFSVPAIHLDRRRIVHVRGENDVDRVGRVCGPWEILQVGHVEVDDAAPWVGLQESGRAMTAVEANFTNGRRAGQLLNPPGIVTDLPIVGRNANEQRRCTRTGIL